MPYVPCPTCGLRTYCIAGEECPVCGTPIGRRSRARSRPRAGADTPALAPMQDLLAEARHQLRMDAAIVSEVRDGREVAICAVGNGRVPAARGADAPLEDTICRRLLDGLISGVVRDTRRDPALRGLPAVRESGVRSFVGVEVEAPGENAFMLCCVASEARPDLGDQSVEFLQGVAEDLRPILRWAVGAV